MFSYYSKKKRFKKTAHEIYGSIVAQTRQPFFYADWGVPDSVEGRFEMLVVHVSLVVRRLNDGDEDGVMIGRLVAEHFIDDLDDSFREMGVGDLGVPKKMKKASEAYLGRLIVYSAALDDDNLGELEVALARNISADSDMPPPDIKALGAYMMASGKALRDQKFDETFSGAVVFAKQ